MLKGKTMKNLGTMIAGRTGLALAVGVATAVWLARRIDRVVHGAMDFAQQMAAGRYDGQPRGSGIVELQRLGTDLKEVARAIAQRERQLERLGLQRTFDDLSRIDAKVRAVCNGF